MDNFQFNSKAETLNKLRKYKLDFKIPKFFFFTVNDWNNSKEEIFIRIFNLFKKKRIIIRSSSLEEDKEDYSAAGKYQSIVIKSYSRENIKKK